MVRKLDMKFIKTILNENFPLPSMAGENCVGLQQQQNHNLGITSPFHLDLASPNKVNRAALGTRFAGMGAANEQQHESGLRP